MNPTAAAQYARRYAYLKHHCSAHIDLIQTWAQRLDPSPELKSSADEQLLMTIPFTGQVRLHSIILRTSPGPDCPKTLKVFVNEEGLDFESAGEKEPTQVLEVSQTSEVQEIGVKRSKFGTTRSLTLFFEDNWSNGEEDETRISYLVRSVVVWG
jgi:hypothetical protein